MTDERSAFPLEIRRVATTTGFSNVTSEVQSVLDDWARDDLIPGHALCCVTVATQGVGLIVTDRDPRAWDLVFGADFLGFPVETDLGRIRGFLLRTSEAFLVKGSQIKGVKGSQILGGRAVYLFDEGSGRECEIAITLL